MAEVQAKRAVAEASLRQTPGQRRVSEDEISRLVATFRDLTGVLADAEPADKAEIYGRLGLA